MGASLGARASRRRSRASERRARALALFHKRSGDAPAVVRAWFRMAGLAASDWIPAFAGMTGQWAGMTRRRREWRARIGGDGAVIVHFRLMPTRPNLFTLSPPPFPRKRESTRRRTQLGRPKTGAARASAGGDARAPGEANLPRHSRESGNPEGGERSWDARKQAPRAALRAGRPRSRGIHKSDNAVGTPENKRRARICGRDARAPGRFGLCEIRNSPLLANRARLIYCISHRQSG